MTLRFEAIESNQLHVFLRSGRRRDRGKVLLRMEHMDVFNNYDGIYCSIIDALRSIAVIDGNEQKPIGIVRDIWNGVRLRVISECDEM